MSANSTLPTRRTPRTNTLPGYVAHCTFDDREAKREFDPDLLLDNPATYDSGYMPDDVTREHSKRMHYAAHRMHKAKSTVELARWTKHYHGLRDLIVLGNRKLIYRAVRRRIANQSVIDDLIGDCHIVLIGAVAAFNPWLGIRFSTYAYTCLIRALSRMAQRSNSDCLLKSVSFDALPDGEPNPRQPGGENNAAIQFPIEEYLREDHPLLSDREKLILTHRYIRGEKPENCTLEQVGKAVGLSKERVRQVQASALDKLRRTLVSPQADS